MASDLALGAMAATISASQFKARCLGLMDQVAATGEVLVITKYGQPVAELHPCAPGRRSTPFGLHPGVIAPMFRSGAGRNIGASPPLGQAVGTGHRREG